MSKNAGNIVLEAKNVVYYYKANKGKKVLDDISYGFEIGKMYAILGPSGSGKTTFLSLLSRSDGCSVNYSTGGNENGKASESFPGGYAGGGHGPAG
mgnify:CR=1 FL=1